ncbi:M14 family metallopeptidase [Hufsiella ginkgonis]|uniref:Peptidase M14 domain-containing protein n=1 Tax=Hufsiella ginkgonis TaxID=2695274 RepID=A0A7K1XZ52_9SPHI|nr:M14 metallopeptidase family protein [Hufsiella ginkgonis]MXV16284.1 hypothetical protein [Hufsiella ginkgonis]
METGRDIFVTLSEMHPRYREASLYDRFFKHTEILTLLKKWKHEPEVKISEIGHSCLGKSVSLVKTGTGPVKVLFWSQMHGDEPTGTMALFDLLNFLFAGSDAFGDIRESILENCTLYLVPMVNPDGAGAFTRRNYQQIDVNRDFHAQQSPEGRLLRSVRDMIEPHFGFNLHDQSIRWSAGNSGNPATVSLLAPAADEPASLTPGRKEAMQVCSVMNATLQQLLPGHIGRFDDTYEPRAFGDNFQSLGTKTILVESGGLVNDPERQVSRKLIFTAFISALHAIATRSYTAEPLENYFTIVPNKPLHVSLLLKNCRIDAENAWYRADLGLVAELDFAEPGKFPGLLYRVEDIGDLSGYAGYETVDATGLTFIPIRPPKLQEPADLILQEGNETILSIENGRITVKTGRLTN